jgi:DNA segregation ATPase FtsK/SpoIIIE-like protein
LLQRRLSIGYGRAAKILDMLEEAGFIGPSNGSKPREVLVSKEEYESGVSALPVHDRRAAVAPASYLEEEGDDGTLYFNGNSEKSAAVTKEDDLKTPDFLLTDDGPEDIIATEDDIIDDAREDAAVAGAVAGTASIPSPEEENPEETAEEADEEIDDESAPDEETEEETGNEEDNDVPMADDKDDDEDEDDDRYFAR